MRRPRAAVVVGFALFVLLVVGGAFVGLRWLTATPGSSYKGPLPPATTAQMSLAERLLAHVVTIASSERNLPRAPAQLDAAANYIRHHLSALGYRVEEQLYPVGRQTARNVAAMIEPEAPSSGGTIVIGAHYDSVVGSPGANDNGTGVAALLELARLLADLRGRAPARIRLVFFTNEEPPYFQTQDMGSFRYAMMLAERKERVAAMYSLETIGFFSDQPKSQRYPFPLGLMYPGKGDFVAFVSMTRSRELLREAIRAFRETTPFPSEGGAAPGLLPGIGWSDHWSFEQFDYPAIMITDTALFRYPYYHTAQDTPDKIDYEKLARITLGVEEMIRRKIAPETGRAQKAP